MSMFLSTSCWIPYIKYFTILGTTYWYYLSGTMPVRYFLEAYNSLGFAYTLLDILLCLNTDNSTYIQSIDHCTSIVLLYTACALQSFHMNYRISMLTCRHTSSVRSSREDVCFISRTHLKDVFQLQR